MNELVVYKNYKVYFKNYFPKIFVNLLKLVCNHHDILLMILENTKTNRTISMEIGLEMLAVVDNDMCTL